jgi:hypothetical protein
VWFSEFGIGDWKKVCDHTQKNEKEERIIIQCSEDSDSDSSDDTTELIENSDLFGVELLDE